MSSLFKSTSNTRQLINGNSRFIRSDVPVNLTNDVIQWLLYEKVFTIIDLREESEQKEKPCPLKDDKRFDYFTMSVTGGNAVNNIPDNASLSL